MKRNITTLLKLLAITNWTAFAIAGLLLVAAWFCTPFEPSTASRKSELARFQAMAAQLDWKPTAMGLIKSRQEMVHVGSTGLRVVIAVSFGFAALGAANLLCLRKLVRSLDDGAIA